jgi:hypothetical protein
VSVYSCAVESRQSANLVTDEWNLEVVVER